MATSHINNVCILGGTHGDEMSGIFLLRKWKNYPNLIKRPSFMTKTVLTNPEAVKLTRRYCYVDLNRSFLKENFEADENLPSTPYEFCRAKELNGMFSEGGKIGPCDMLIDLHNTTANMKMCAIHTDLSDVTMQLLSYLTLKFPKDACHILYYPGFEGDTTTLAKQGIALEGGPQPQGVVREDIMKLHEEAVMHCLDFIEIYNAGNVFDSTTVVIHEVLEYIKFPRDSEGSIDAAVHESLQDNDWGPIRCADPVFRRFDGTVLQLGDVAKSDSLASDIFYPCFINEAAYYEKDVAFLISTRREIFIPKLKKF